MRKRRRLIGLCSVMLGGWFIAASVCTAATSDDLLQLRVIDTAGKIVPGAEAFVLDVSYGLPVTRTWAVAENGVISIDGTNRSRDYEGQIIEGGFDVLIRAPGYAWAMQRVDLPEPEPVAITLDTGREIMLHIEAGDGRALPDDLEPIVFVESLGTATWITGVQSYERRLREPDTVVIASPVVRRDYGMYAVRVPTDLEAFHVLIHHRGFLRCFAHGPIILDDLEDAIAHIKLPESIEVSLDLVPSDEAPTDYSACGVSVGHSPAVPAGWTFYIEDRFQEEKSWRTVFTDLAPGGYTFTAFTGTKDTWRDRTRDEFCEIRRWQELAAGESVRLEYALETFEVAYWRDKLRGEYDVTLDIKLSDDSPAAGKSFKAEYYLARLGKTVELASGMVPENGLVHLKQVGNAAVVVLTINDNIVDELYLQGEEMSQTFAYALAPTVGDAALDFEMTELKSRDAFRLSDLKGQVVLLEFWASWCGPCQAPMRKNNELMKRRGGSWRDVVTLLGVSIDNKIETIIDHVDERNWNAVRQVFVPGAWGADVLKLYGVKSLPTAILIDAEGVVVWSGHPTEIEIELEIDKLLARTEE